MNKACPVATVKAEGASGISTDLQGCTATGDNAASQIKSGVHHLITVSAHGLFRPHLFL